jgi:hypothetical protein
MAISDPVKVPETKIGSVDLNGWSGGLFLNGQEIAEGNQFVDSSDIELSPNGRIKPRRSLQKWLPDTVETVYEVFPARVDNELYFFVADENKLKYCQQGDEGWTDCDGDNTITTNNGGKTTFIRVLNSILVLNGGNGDKLCYIDLEDPTFPVVKYTFVANPTDPVTAAATGITASGDYKIYYGWTYSSATGETEISPILEQAISKPRDQWDPDGTEYLTLTFPDFGAEPAGSTYRNLYIALAANGGVIQPSDMLMLAAGLDLNQEKFVDTGVLAIDIGRGNPPAVNATDGPRVDHGIETNGRPVLFGDVDEPDNIWIGGDGDYARDFSSANGGFRSQPAKGTNYYPASVIGFRNGQGIPSLTILFSNTQGLSKQATLEQQTINYGNQSFVVWGVTEQNYGAAGVASPYGVVNYKGQLCFPSTDGMLSMDTAPQLQNVLSTKEIDKAIKQYVQRVNVSALSEIVGTAWNNKFMWIVPAYGFVTPNNVLVRDLDNNGAWYVLGIEAQWIGTVSPPNSPAFVYICQGNKILKLYDAFGTVDYVDGVSTFPTSVTGAMVGINDAHNAFQALVQAVFYLLDIIGTVTVGVNYRDQNFELRNEEVTFVGPEYVRSSSGGWSDPEYMYAGLASPNWTQSTEIDETSSALVRVDKRIKIPISDLASEIQWYLRTPSGYNDYLLRTVSYEGENLGVKPDLG